MHAWQGQGMSDTHLLKTSSSSLWIDKPPVVVRLCDPFTHSFIHSYKKSLEFGTSPPRLLRLHKHTSCQSIPIQFIQIQFIQIQSNPIHPSIQIKLHAFCPSNHTQVNKRKQRQCTSDRTGQDQINPRNKLVTSCLPFSKLKH